MTDYFGVFLAGISTGAGVIIAQKFFNWLEDHPIVVRMKRHANDITGHDDDEDRRNGVRKHRPRF